MNDSDKNVYVFERDTGSKSTPHQPVLNRLKEDPDVQLGMHMQRFRMEIAIQLKAWRTSAGLSQRDVAEKMASTQKQVSRMESCTQSSNITMDMVSRFAFVCGVEPTLVGTATKTNVETFPKEKP